VETAQGEVVSDSEFEPTRYKTAMRPDTAATVRDLMVEVVNNGTGTRAQIPGIQVAGKTGTAQVEGNDAPHAWFIGFAPAEAPRYAVAVLVENGGDLGSEATGGRVAAPIAAEVLKALLQP
jgi:peptidoglycan glycosyltransferase